MVLKGVYVPVVTPFDDDDEIDHAALATVVNSVLDAGATGVVPCGSTGEFYALSDIERLDVLRTVHDTVQKRVQLVAGSNAGSTRDVIRHMRAAAELGYDAVMLAPPYYSLPSQAELLTHFRSVAAAVEIPIILYNFPARAGVEIGYEVLDGLQDADTVVAIKESSGDIGRLHQMLDRYGDRYQLVCGADDQAFEFAAWGVRSWIAGIGSCVPRQCVAVLDALERGDLAGSRSAMLRLMPLASEAERGKFIQTVKYGCELAGLPVGHVRAPLCDLDGREKATVRRVFEFATAEVKLGPLDGERAGAR